ncbi:hypothetical protein DFP72DRAFT_1166142 [Ephemerocybe angulata]|uniref:RING-type domain-containing protein n=1 Tax=Ephemerocybe angulata TaxID=980116 RepID=A0A8H6IAX2_9AGAR|nr:hypothetical protein DFP72DRAFT_1166142 [Tulosesus angulatus]
MLTLAHGCSCDVCAEEYGAQRLPHSIPCGHVLCAACCTTIIDKTAPPKAPSCPFCRVPFNAGEIRLIRMDFTTSGWTTPRRLPTVEANTITSDLLARRTERLLSSNDGRTRLDARRLEDKVAKVAAKKCSVEEVSVLHKELEDWLLAEKDDQTSSLYLSAALLRAILMNHMAHSEASKNAKATENGLKSKIEHLERQNEELSDEARRQRSNFMSKTQECQQLRNEISQLKALATTLGVSAHELPPSTPQLPTPPSTSPTPYSTSSSTSTSASASAHVSRFHSRSASMSNRPSTPAAVSPISPSRSHTPGMPSPTRTSSASASAAASRPSTPAYGLRTYTPAPAQAPPMPSMPTRYAATPSPMRSSASQHAAHAQQHSSLYASYTPAPLVPPKPRRLSHSQGSSPPKLARSMSEEKAEAHERWLPSDMMGGGGGEEKKSGGGRGERPPSRMQGFSSAAYAASRLRDLRVTSPS